MAKLYNIENNIMLEINLLNNLLLDINIERSPTENWIPFDLNLKYDKDEVFYSRERGCTFSLFEILRFIENIETKDKFYKVHFCSCERYFELNFFKADVKNEILVEFWIDIGSYTNGKKYGYEKGLRFVTDEKKLKTFVKTLKLQLDRLIREV